MVNARQITCWIKPSIHARKFPLPTHSRYWQNHCFQPGLYWKFNLIAHHRNLRHLHLQSHRSIPAHIRNDQWLPTVTFSPHDAASLKRSQESDRNVDFILISQPQSRGSYPLSGWAEYALPKQRWQSARCRVLWTVSDHGGRRAESPFFKLLIRTPWNRWDCEDSWKYKEIKIWGKHSEKRRTGLLNRIKLTVVGYIYFE